MLLSALRPLFELGAFDEVVPVLLEALVVLVAVGDEEEFLGDFLAVAGGGNEAAVVGLAFVGADKEVGEGEDVAGGLGGEGDDFGCGDGVE